MMSIGRDEVKGHGFHGNDGLWSTFIMRIGSPAQNFHILPSTNGDNVVIPLIDGCAGDGGISATLCGSLRGAMPFNNRESTGFAVNSSTSWRNIGIFSLPLGQQWGIEGVAQYGYDTVGLAVQNSGGPTLEEQVVAGIAMKEFFLGVFPLGTKPTNFSTFENPQPSYLVSLKGHDVIPGLGFGYTAGAHYQYTGVTGSLVVGGYDASRLDSNRTKTFAFGHDDNHSFMVGLQNIVAVNTLQGTVSPLTDGVVVSIDSTLPYLWLPGEVCDRFQAAFGLTYDEYSQMYLVNNTIHERLKQLNPRLSLTLGDGTNSGTGSAVVIDLPYAAFDLQASWPIMENATNYFPLKRATNSTQYTLGRTFLQEAYLSADYERRIFNVSQATFASPMPEQEIVPVEPIMNATEATTHPSPHSLSVPSKVGIGIGVAGAAILTLVVGLFCYKRRHGAQASPSPEVPCSPDALTVDAKEAASADIFEFHEDVRPNEADSDGSQRYELSSSQRPLELSPEGRVHEMMAENKVHEMA
ncbi:hypothetical protein SLS54_003174 [Diplodia seriata]